MRVLISTLLALLAYLSSRRSGRSHPHQGYPVVFYCNGIKCERSQDGCTQLSGASRELNKASSHLQELVAQFRT